MAHIRRENRTKSNMIHIGNIFCDFTVRKIYVNEAEINMTSTEYEICSLLMRNPNRVFTKDEIYEKLLDLTAWGRRNDNKRKNKRNQKKI